jgi:hypothetical protein
MKAKKSKKEKPVPKACACGRPAALVKAREGKMVTCPDPVNCVANLRTRWCSHEETAIAEWNNLVCTYRGGR